MAITKKDDTKMKMKMITIALLATILAAPAHAFKETPLSDIVAQYGVENEMLLGYTAGFRDAWAYAQIEIVSVQEGEKEVAKRVYLCAATLDAREIVRLAYVSFGSLTTTDALQKTLDKLCWSSARA